MLAVNGWLGCGYMSVMRRSGVDGLVRMVVASIYIEDHGLCTVFVHHLHQCH